jgi:hypothetical protein
MNLNEVCREMKTLGFEYGSLVKNPKRSFVFIPHAIGMASLKPLGNVLWFSRITVTETDEATLEWKEWIEMEDFDVECYEYRDLLFAKVDPGRIANETHPALQAGGEWRHEEEWISMVNWEGVAAQYAGISVRQSRLFPTWDVDTLAVWDPSSCITETRTFCNTGAKWTYKPDACPDGPSWPTTAQCPLTQS